MKKKQVSAVSKDGKKGPIQKGKLVRRRFKELHVIADETVQVHDVRDVTLSVPATFIQEIHPQVEFLGDTVLAGKLVKQFRVHKIIKYVPEGESGKVMFDRESFDLEAFVEAPVSPTDELDIENFVLRVVPVLEPLEPVPTTRWREKTIVDLRVIVSRIVVVSALTNTVDRFDRRVGPMNYDFVSKIQ